jgi:TolB-like protein
VKPSNLMLDRSGVVKVLDLGLAAFDARGPEALTGSGEVLGTVDYLAPEQADPVCPVDGRADVYSLGCSLYFFLTGSAPYSGPAYPTARSKILAHTAGPIPRIRDARPDVPPELACALERMLAKDPADRYPTPAAVASALAPFCCGADLLRLLSAIGIEPRIRVTVDPPTGAVPVSTGAPHGRWSARVVLVAVLAVLLVGGGLSAAVRFWLRPPAPPILQADPQGQDLSPPQPPEPKRAGGKDVLPVALLAFEERDAAKGFGAKVTELLFAKLATRPTLFLVDRGDLKKVLDEQALGLSGAVKADEAAQVGQLTGAKLLVTGSVVVATESTKLHLVAKIISTETGRVVGASVEGVQSDDLGVLVGRLADAIEATIARQGEKLVPGPGAVEDRVAELSKKLGKGPRRSLTVRITEQHIGQPIGSAPARTEMNRFARATGFEVLEDGPADVIITGEGIISSSGRVGGMVSVRARLELRAVERASGRVLVADRQTTVAVDLSEQLAGSSALQDAAARLAERVLPECVVPTPKK